ncbi:unnamed protein product [Lepeophtheirus salmonis]|uniref:(salmon louse) hypothetical protein n=1 Tax=Lepeophtheirus salmonis TaxID=72036 RepID=A0A7R8D201_LEPSM|nr:unnamed protein product [Lepeophtheirus salmonis]CAF2996549.1 unnamed protein product [Lepeophtheirus salmonis]
MSEQDDEAIVETVEDPYFVDSPPSYPSIMERVMQKGLDLVISPWFILGFAAIAYYLYVHYIRNWIYNWRQHLRPWKKARSRLQSEHEKAAATHASKRSKLEEEKRKKKVDDWEVLKKGGSLKNKKDSESTSKKQNYFPLMGSGEGDTCYRSNRRSESGRGG